MKYKSSTKAKMRRRKRQHCCCDQTILVPIPQPHSRLASPAGRKSPASSNSVRHQATEPLPLVRPVLDEEQPRLSVSPQPPYLLMTDSPIALDVQRTKARNRSQHNHQNYWSNTVLRPPPLDERISASIFDLPVPSKNTRSDHGGDPATAFAAVKGTTDQPSIVGGIQGPKQRSSSVLAVNPFAEDYALVSAEQCPTDGCW